MNEPRRRATSLSPPDFLLLDQWGCHLCEVFDETAYCVGSVTRGARDYRDVDVRMLLPDGAEWVAASKIRLRAVNLAVSMWGRQATGLPIDFQFQPSEDFHGYDDEHRHALGISWRIGVQEARADV